VDDSGHGATQVVSWAVRRQRDVAPADASAWDTIGLFETNSSAHVIGSRDHYQRGSRRERRDPRV
jgi:hypothetical protein